MTRPALEMADKYANRSRERLWVPRVFIGKESGAPASPIF